MTFNRRESINIACVFGTLKSVLMALDKLESFKYIYPSQDLIPTTPQDLRLSR